MIKEANTLLTFIIWLITQVGNVFYLIDLISEWQDSIYKQ